MTHLASSCPRYLFLAMLAAQSAIAFSLPLVPNQNDSAWYYMNVHFVETGQYIHEGVYRFSEPSQLYPFFGYSFLLYSCTKIAALTGISFAFVVKLTQLIMYLLTALMTVEMTFDLTGKKTLSYFCGLFFLLYYSHFSFVYVVMSETYAVFLLMLCSYLFTRSLFTMSSRFCGPLFIACGILVMVKPVLLPTVACFAVLLASKALRTKNYRILLLLPLLLSFPAIQSLFSKAYYDNYEIRSGFGWNLWNRVIWNDRLLPTRSEDLSKLMRIYEDRGAKVRFGFWWEVARELSEFGYSETDTQEILREIALDGVREFPLRYTKSVLIDTYRSFLDPIEIREVHDSHDKYFSLISAFANDRQHLPLVRQLEEQSPNRLGRGLLVTLHSKMASVFNGLVGVFHSRAVFVLFLMSGFYCAWQLVRSRRQACVEASAFWLTAFSLVLCSNMVEVRWDRFTLPAVMFIFLSIVLTANHFIDKARLRHRPEERRTS